MKTLKGLCVLIGRILIAVLFAESAFGKITGFKMMVDYAKANGVTGGTEFLVIASTILEIVGLILLVVGYKVEIGSIALLIFMIPVTLIFHSFWKFTGMDMMNQMVQFMKNIAVIGGLLFILGMGAGPFSIDNNMSKKN
jgi:putative oxidoreductase